jgi:hypothetical protein
LGSFINMTTERLVRIIAGSFILVSLLLAHVVNGIDLTRPTWLWFAVFVGANLFQSGLTRWCLLESILVRAGVPTSSEARARGRPASP